MVQDWASSTTVRCSMTRADYIEHPEQSPLREGWRFELVGSRLDDLLSGNMGLTVKDGKIELL